MKCAKKLATKHSTQHRLHQQVPSAEVFLQHNQNRGHRLGRSVRELNEWLDQYSAHSLEQAMQRALAKHCCHTAGVLQILEQLRERKQHPVPLPGVLPTKAFEQTPYTLASLQSYESLHQAIDSYTVVTNTTDHTDPEYIHTGTETLHDRFDNHRRISQTR